MFQTADWNVPHVGGLLSQVIVKEESQLQRKPPAHTVRHIWDHKYIDQRPSTWRDAKVRRQPPGQLQLTTTGATSQGPSRANMLHRRRMDQNLAALKRSAEVGDGEGKQLASFTPELYSNLHPTYGVGESYATQTSSQIIGFGNDCLGIKSSRYCRDNTMKSQFVDARNIPDRTMVEAARKLLAGTPPPNPRLPGEKARLRHASVERPESYPTAYRSSNSAFCPRPNDIPVPGSTFVSRQPRVSSTRPW